jgi:hypothetical protein
VCPDANLKDGIEKYSTPVESTSVAGIMEVIEDGFGRLKELGEELMGGKSILGPY